MAQYPENRVLRFVLLGVFSCGSSGEEIAKNNALICKMGKKALSFLQYMVVNHGRCISSEELIEQFWNDGSSDPVNALRNMLFRMRGLLKTMFPYPDGILLTVQDGYTWNPELRLEIDAEQLEALCMQARGRDDEERCRLLDRAVALYKGDFLSANDGEWTRPLRQYYQTLYLDACRAVLPLLYQKEQWLEIVGICSRAYAVDFSKEEFTAYQMKALIALEQPEQAMEKYEAYKEQLLREYNMLPSEEVESLCDQIMEQRGNNRQNQDILKLVCEGETDAKAFFCTFATFRNIVTLERRHIRRSGQPSTLVLISLGEGAVPAQDGKRLERVLLEKLGTGDPIARLEAGTYVILLPGADEEAARLMFGRIDSAFHRTWRHSAANLTFQMADLRMLL